MDIAGELDIRNTLGTIAIIKHLGLGLVLNPLSHIILECVYETSSVFGFDRWKLKELDKLVKQIYCNFSFFDVLSCFYIKCFEKSNISPPLQNKIRVFSSYAVESVSFFFCTCVINQKKLKSVTTAKWMIANVQPSALKSALLFKCIM